MSKATPRPPKMTVDGSGSFREMSVSTINSREKLCQHCWNVRTKTVIYIRRDWFTRGALAIATIAVILCTWVALDSHLSAKATSTGN